MHKEEFEESCASIDDTFTDGSMEEFDENNKPKPKGELIVINVDLGARGH